MFSNRPATADVKAAKRALLQQEMQLAMSQQKAGPRISSGAASRPPVNDENMRMPVNVQHYNPPISTNQYGSYQQQPQPAHSRPQSANKQYHVAPLQPVVREQTPVEAYRQQPPVAASHAYNLNTSSYQPINTAPLAARSPSRPNSRQQYNPTPDDLNNTGVTLNLVNQRPSTAVRRQEQKLQYKAELEAQLREKQHAAMQEQAEKQRLKGENERKQLQLLEQQRVQREQQQQYAAQQAQQQQQRMQTLDTTYSTINRPKLDTTDEKVADNPMFQNRPSTAHQRQQKKDELQREMQQAMLAQQRQRGRRNSPPQQQQQPADSSHSYQQPSYNQRPMSASHGACQQQPAMSPTSHNGYNQTPQQQQYDQHQEPLSTAAMLAREHAATLMSQQTRSPTSGMRHHEYEAQAPHSPQSHNYQQHYNHYQPPIQQAPPAPAYLQPIIIQSPPPPQHMYYAPPPMPNYSMMQHQPMMQMPEHQMYQTQSTHQPYQQYGGHPSYTTQYDQTSPTHASSAYNNPASPTRAAQLSNETSLNTTITTSGPAAVSTKHMHSGGMHASELQAKHDKQKQYQLELQQQMQQKEQQKALLLQQQQEFETRKEREIDEIQASLNEIGKQRGGRARVQGRDANESSTSTKHRAAEAPRAKTPQLPSPTNAPYADVTAAAVHYDSEPLNSTATASTNGKRGFMSGLSGLRAGLSEEQAEKQASAKLELQRALQLQVQQKEEQKRKQVEAKKAEEEKERQQEALANAEAIASQSQKCRPSSNAAGGKMAHTPPQEQRQLTDKQQYQRELQQQMQEQQDRKVSEKQKNRNTVDWDASAQQPSNAVMAPAADFKPGKMARTPPQAYKRVEQQPVEEPKAQPAYKLEQATESALDGSTFLQSHDALDDMVNNLQQTSRRPSMASQQPHALDQSSAGSGSLLAELKRQADQTKDALQRMELRMIASTQQQQQQPHQLTGQLETLNPFQRPMQHHPQIPTLPLHQLQTGYYPPQQPMQMTSTQPYQGYMHNTHTPTMQPAPVSDAPLQYTSRLLPVDDGLLQPNQQRNTLSRTGQHSSHHPSSAGPRSGTFQRNAMNTMNTNNTTSPSQVFNPTAGRTTRSNSVNVLSNDNSIDNRLRTAQQSMQPLTRQPSAQSQAPRALVNEQNDSLASVSESGVFVVKHAAPATQEDTDYHDDFQGQENDEPEVMPETYAQTYPTKSSIPPRLPSRIVEEESAVLVPSGRQSQSHHYQQSPVKAVHRPPSQGNPTAPVMAPLSLHAFGLSNEVLRSEDFVSSPPTQRAVHTHKHQHSTYPSVIGEGDMIEDMVVTGMDGPSSNEEKQQFTSEDDRIDTQRGADAPTTALMSDAGNQTTLFSVLGAVDTQRSEQKEQSDGNGKAAPGRKQWLKPTNAEVANLHQSINNFEVVQVDNQANANEFNDALVDY